MAVMKTRWMIRNDIFEVNKIENDAFPDSWGEEQIIKALCQRAIIGIVAEIEDSIEAWALYELHTDCLEILRIGGSKEGVIALLDKLKNKLCKSRRHTLLYLVPETDLEMQRFLRDHAEMHVTRTIREHADDIALYKFEYSTKEKSSLCDV